MIYVPTDNTVANNTEIVNNICQPAGVPVVYEALFGEHADEKKIIYFPYQLVRRNFRKLLQ